MGEKEKESGAQTLGATRRSKWRGRWTTRKLLSSPTRGFTCTTISRTFSVPGCYRPLPPFWRQRGRDQSYLHKPVNQELQNRWKISFYCRLRAFWRTSFLLSFGICSLLETHLSPPCHLRPLLRHLRPSRGHIARLTLIWTSSLLSFELEREEETKISIVG